MNAIITINPSSNLETLNSIHNLNVVKKIYRTQGIYNYKNFFSLPTQVCAITERFGYTSFFCCIVYEKETVAFSAELAKTKLFLTKSTHRIEFKSCKRLEAPRKLNYCYFRAK